MTMQMLKIHISAMSFEKAVECLFKLGSLKKITNYPFPPKSSTAIHSTIGDFTFDYVPNEKINSLMTRLWRR